MSEDQIDLVEELAEALAEYIIGDYTAEDYQGSPFIERMAQVAAMVQVKGRPVPPSIAEVLRHAAEAGRPIGVA